jgi:hypothetical protein
MVLYIILPFDQRTLAQMELLPMKIVLARGSEKKNY